jgi:hypothetical protein
MNSQGFKAFFRFGVWITLLSMLLLFVVKPGSAEFVVTILTIGIGVLLMVLVALAIRFIS